VTFDSGAGGRTAAALLSTLVMAGACLPVALFRLVDGDEGIFLAAVRLVGEGRALYHDFHFPQMPVVPYLYAAWMKLVGLGWYEGRLLSAVLAIGVGMLLHGHVASATRRPWLAFGATAALASSALFFAWFPAVKTYAAGGLFAFAAYVILEARPRRWTPFVVGLLLGMGASTRLYLGALAPVFAGAIGSRAPSRRAGWRQMGAFGAGLVLAFAPVAFMAAADVDTFLFNVVGYHGLRTAGGYLGDVTGRVTPLRWALDPTGPEGATAFQFSLLALATLAVVAVTLRAQRRPPLSAAAAGVLMVVSLAPSPSYAQYFCLLVPFLVAHLAVGFERLPAGRARRGLGISLAVALVAQVAVAPIEARRFLVTGWNVPGILGPSDVPNWRLPVVLAVGAAVDQAVPSDAGPSVMSFWPGYFVETRATIAPRFENPFSLFYSSRMSDAEAGRRGFPIWPELAVGLASSRWPVVVFGNSPHSRKPQRDLRGYLLRGGYVLVRRVADAEIYAAQAPPGGSQ